MTALRDSAIMALREGSRSTAQARRQIAMTDITPRQALSDAIRYWEPRRVFFNVVLAIVVGTVYLASFPQKHQTPAFEVIQALFLMAVLANVAYCAVYPVDILAQLSAFRGTWLRLRWVLLLVGLLFAAILTNFLSRGFFG